MSLYLLHFFGYHLSTFSQELKGKNVEGVLVLKHPWPSIARTIYQDHKRYLETYMQPYPGYFYTGDGAARDEDGYIWIKGRVDGRLSFSATDCHVNLSTGLKTLSTYPVIVCLLLKLSRPSFCIRELQKLLLLALQKR